MGRCLRWACGAVLVLQGMAHADVPQIVVGKDAPALERLAAEEVAEAIQSLSGEKASIAAALPDGSAPVILIGTPETNPAVKAALRDAWPKLSDQGHVLKSARVDGRPALVVGGGSPVATFWAAAELAHRWGIRSLLMGNLKPVEKKPLTLDGFDAVLEPALKHRAWTMMDATPVGPAAWGLADHKKLLRQLARLKFNRIDLDIACWQPFFQWHHKDVAKASSLLWPEGPIKVDGDTAGRAAFKGLPVFDNPDFAGKTTDADRTKAGIALLTGIIDEAHRLGMTVGIAIAPFEFAKEFEGLLEDAEPAFENGDLAVMPGEKSPLYSDDVQQMALAQVKAILEAYPKIDALLLDAPVDSHGDAVKAWKALQAAGTISKTATPEAILNEARTRKGILSGDEGQTLVGAQVAALPALRRLAEHPDVSRRKDGSLLDVEITGIDPALARLALRITPDGVGPLFVPEEPPAEPVTAPLKLVGSLDWSDLHVGVLPRFHTQAAAAAMKNLRERKWRGFRVHAPIAGGMDPTALFVSRAAFDEELTPEASLRDLLDTIAGEGVSDRVLKAFTLIEDAVKDTDFASLADASPDDQVLLRHQGLQSAPEWWAKVRDANTHAMDEMYRANTRAREGGREFTLYYARKFEFGMEVMNALEAARLASAAAGEGNKEKQTEQLEKAVESLYGALNAYAAVARDPSDRGVIALLNQHGYRVYQEQLDALGK